MITEDHYKHLNSELLPIEDIVVGDRFRVEYKKMDELCASITEHGLIHYPVVDQFSTLIAGGRRLEALRRLGWTMIPVTRKSCLTDSKLRELELEENLQREALSWQEEIALKDEIVKLKKEIHGEKGVGRGAVNSSGISNKDIAEQLGESQANLSMDLTLAKAMESMPQLKDCKTKDEARKKLKQIQETLIVEELRKRHSAISEEKTSSAKFSFYKVAEANFRICDAFEGLKNLPVDNDIKFINVDTPYGIDLNNVKKSNSPEPTSIIEHDYKEWESVDFLAKCEQIMQECFRISNDDTIMTWWFAIQWYQPLSDLLRKTGWSIDPIPNLWTVGDQGQTNQPEIYLARSYEPFFACRKGKPIIMKRGRANVFQFPRVASTTKIHQTEKPIPLMAEIFKTYASPGCKILVPFLGSGNDILAGFATQNEVFGFDLNNEVKKRFLIRVAEMENKK